MSKPQLYKLTSLPRFYNPRTGFSSDAEIDIPALTACEDCGKPYGTDGWLDVTIPDEQWEAITGRSDGGGILCGACIIKRGRKLPGIHAGRLVFESTPDPMNGHQCEKIAQILPIGEGREVWLGKLLAPIEGYPLETHCLHVKTPATEVTFGVNLGDMAALATLCFIVHNGPFNTRWLELMAQHYKATVRERK